MLFSLGLSALLSRLQGVRKSGRGWQARCPAHDDRQPSLSVHEGDDGRTLVHCQRGCHPDSVIAAVGMTWAELRGDGDLEWNERKGEGEMGRKGEKTSNLESQISASPCLPFSTSPLPFWTFEEACQRVKRQLGVPVANAWKYHDAQGNEVGAVLRFNRPEGGKEFRPLVCRWGRWQLGGLETPRPLYALPEVLQGGPVYLCEGEKAADAGRRLGLVCTTTAHGANSPDKTDFTPLAGREVTILPDNDDPGEQYAESVTQLLSRLTPPARVRIVALPDLPHKGDLFDFVEARSGQPRDEVRQELEALAAATPWIEAESQGGAAARQLWQPFPVEALPEPAASYVRAAAEAIGCDAAFVALPLLSALAATIGAKRRMRLKHNWTEPAILWTAIVGDSGSRKSAAIDAAVRFLREREVLALTEHQEALRRYDQECEIYERDLAQWKRRGAAGDPPARPQEPAAQRWITNDATLEALAALLAENPRGLLYFHGELATWLCGFDRYHSGRGTDVARWLEMYGGNALSVDRRTGDKRRLTIPQAAVSVAGGIQPEALKRALPQSLRDNGLMARLLFACPPPQAAWWTDADVSEGLLNEMEDLFAELDALDFREDEAGRKRPWLVTATPEALDAFKAFKNEMADQTLRLNSELAAAWSKLEGAAARIALVVHLCRAAAVNTAGQASSGTREKINPQEADERSMLAGIALARWFGHEAKRVYALLNEDVRDRRQRQLLELVQRLGGAVTPREVLRSSKLWLNAAEAHRALEELSAAGYGHWEDVPPREKGGRPYVRFCLKPRVD